MYPRSTVDLAKTLSDLGILDRENAAICGVSVGAVRKWRYGSRRDGNRSRHEDVPRCPRCHGRPLDEKPTRTCSASTSATDTWSCAGRVSGFCRSHAVMDGPD